MSKELLAQAATAVIRAQGASSGLLMHELDTDFDVASRLIDELHRLGIIAGPNGSQRREVLYRPGQLDTAINKIQKEN
jgi:DNA segregation ATPase FtsK/SpoIIIE-like protein